MAAIKFQKPALFRKDMDAVLQTMVDEKIGPAEKKKQFVKAFADYTRKKDGIAFRSYMDAISVALNSFGLEEGDGVALSVFTPEVYLTVVKSLGLKPVVLDVDDEMMISAEEIRKNMDSIKAIVYFEPICQLPTDPQEIKEIGLPILEDISQSVGSMNGDIKPGRVGTIVISATEEDAVVSTAGGAVILSDDEVVLERMKKEIENYSSYVEMADLNASLGIVQLAKLDSVVARRNSIYKTYQQAVMKTSAKMFGQGSVDFFPNGYGFSVIVNERPDETIAFAQRYQVTARKTFSKAIGARYQDRYDKYPHGVPALARAVSFPLYPFLASAEIDTIQKVIAHLR
ncbi:MAG: DegT/DnrJ/EryC1/StrS aminotransferase family protein [Spirochaetales bacterium]|nr:DegT/DnrJ/EryC1/StrS aminotransferase family protein [Candidatus Physcosoma equi]